MAFRRRFQSGTLGRSIQRFGRFPGGGMSRFKKKNFSWQYVELNEAAVSLAPGPLDIILFNASDWVDVSATGVKNVSLDLRLMFTWTPTVVAIEYDSWWVRGGIFVLDVDETGGTISSTFAAHRALWWNAAGRNTGEQPAAQGASPDIRNINWTVRARQRFMKFDEELRFLFGFFATVTGTIADARMSIFGRISWETP